MEPAERAEVLQAWGRTRSWTARRNSCYAIGQNDPQALLSFLMARVREDQACDEGSRDTKKAEEDRCEPIPATARPMLCWITNGMMPIAREPGYVGFLIPPGVRRHGPHGGPPLAPAGPGRCN